MVSRSSFTVMFAFVFAAVLTACGSTAPTAIPTAAPTAIQTTAPTAAAASTSDATSDATAASTADATADATAASTDSAVSANSSTNGPADAAKAFIAAEYSGGVIDQLICTGNADAIEGIRMMALAVNASSGVSLSKFDVSALTYTTANQTADAADVKISGKVTTTSIAGTSSAADFPALTLKMVNQSGWKVCGTSS